MTVGHETLLRAETELMLAVFSKETGENKPSTPKDAGSPLFTRAPALKFYFYQLKTEKPFFFFNITARCWHSLASSTVFIPVCCSFVACPRKAASCHLTPCG